MDVLIVEDEPLAADRLADLLLRQDPSVRVVGRLDSVEETVAWFTHQPPPHLLLLDIRLADGLSFDIFQQVTINCPIIFTTAYDQYAIQAFKVNSIDYLLKPVAPEDLRRALDKLRHLTGDLHNAPPVDFQQIAEAVRKLQRTYKARFVVRYGDRLQAKPLNEIAYFCADGKVVYLLSTDGRRFIVDYTLEQLEELLDPAIFYRLNRKFTARLEAVQEIRACPGSRLRLVLKPATEAEVIISRDRVAHFKAWLDR